MEKLIIKRDAFRSRLMFLDIGGDGKNLKLFIPSDAGSWNPAKTCPASIRQHDIKALVGFIGEAVSHTKELAVYFAV